MSTTDSVFAKFRAELEQAVPGLEIVTDEATRAERSHDWWVRANMERRRDGGGPVADAVVRPKDSAEVAALLRWADTRRVPVVPFGLGSGVCGAVLSGPGQIILDMGAMDQLLHVDTDADIAVVQPGMRGTDFEAALERHGVTMGHWPQSVALSTVGGWCATRASGQYSTYYGNIEDMLLGCEVALPGGRLARVPAVPRASAGPDLKQVFLGSEGTLGVFTELTFRVRPLPSYSGCSSYAFEDVATGMRVLQKIVQSGWRPAVTRLHDAFEAGRNFAGIKTPNKPILLLMSEGERSRVETEIVAMHEIAEAEGGIDNGPDPVGSWMEHRNDVPSFDTLFDKGVVFDTIEVAVVWPRLAELYDKVCREATEIEGVMAMSGHVSHCYTQGANIYFTFLAAEQDLHRGIELYDKVWDTTCAAAHAVGGTVAHHHGIGRARKAWLRQELGESIEVLGAIKRALDPNGIMNPGVLIDVDS